MTDLETRLAAALTAVVADAPSTAGLADGARRRLRARRRTRGVVGGVLAVLLVAVPVGVVTRDSSPVVVRPDVVAPPVADGRTTVTWEDLVLEVPPEWAEGDTCGNTGVPVVTRGAAVLCPGLDGYGVRFGPYPPAATLAVTDEMQRAEGPNWPEGAWWANLQLVGSSNVATVVTPDRETGQRILDSARLAGWSDDGWRIETWSGLSVEVPGDWLPGAPSAYCVGGGSPERGFVQRPDTELRTIRCRDPHHGLGLTFGSAAAYDTVYPSGHVWQYTGGQEYVEGSWLGHWYDGDRLVRVNAGDRQTVERILESLSAGDG